MITLQEPLYYVGDFTEGIGAAGFERFFRASEIRLYLTGQMMIKSLERYVLFSEIPNYLMLRWQEVTGEISVSLRFL